MNGVLGDGNAEADLFAGDYFEIGEAHFGDLCAPEEGAVFIDGDTHLFAVLTEVSEPPRGAHRTRAVVVFPLAPIDAEQRSVERKMDVARIVSDIAGRFGSDLHGDLKLCKLGALGDVVGNKVLDVPVRHPYNTGVEALGIGKAGGIVKPAHDVLARCHAAGGVRVIVGILSDVDTRRLHPALLARAGEKIDDDLVRGERADLLRAADARGRRDLDEPRRVQFFDVRRDRAVGDIEPLGKIGEVELLVLQKLLQNAQPHV